ncbi:MAG: peptidoglycan-binding protein [Candidatus Saccharibacteria bacterium]
MKKLNTHGVAHFAALAIIILGVASYGTYRLVASHAATLNSASCQASKVQLSAASHSTGPCVTFAQQKVGATPDGAFGPLTAGKVVAFQKLHNIVPDGIVGPCTWAAMNTPASVPTSCLVVKPAPVAAKPVAPVAAKPAPVAAKPVPVVAQPAPVAVAKPVVPVANPCPTTRPLLTSGSKGACVVFVQSKVGATPADGNFGPVTAAKVRAFQLSKGLTQDGTVGPCTWAAINGQATSTACKAPTKVTSSAPKATTTQQASSVPAISASHSPSTSAPTGYAWGTYCYTDSRGVKHTNFVSQAACDVAKKNNASKPSNVVSTINCSYYDYSSRHQVSYRLTAKQCADYKLSNTKPAPKPNVIQQAVKCGTNGKCLLGITW